MYDKEITFLISMLPSFITTLSLFVGFYFHILKKIDERLEKERYSEDRANLLKEFDIKLEAMKKEIEIREVARSQQLDRIESVLEKIQEHMINCNKRGWAKACPLFFCLNKKRKILSEK